MQIGRAQMNLSRPVDDDSFAFVILPIPIHPSNTIQLKLAKSLRRKMSKHFLSAMASNGLGDDNSDKCVDDFFAEVIRLIILGVDLLSHINQVTSQAVAKRITLVIHGLLLLEDSVENLINLLQFDVKAHVKCWNSFIY